MPIECADTSTPLTPVIQRVLYALIITGVGIRLTEFSHINLWEDEIISVTHAVQPFWELLVNVARNDIHPPLYFLQLYLWSFVSTSDAWFLANSIAWGTVSIGAIWYVAHRLYGKKAGIMAATALALLPMAVAQSQLVRMYPMLTVLVVLSFYIIERTLVRADMPLKGRYLFGLALVNVAIIVSHVLGMVLVFFLGLYSFIGILHRRALRSEYFKWICVYGALAIVALPTVVSAILHTPDPGTMRTSSSISITIFKVISSLFIGGSAYRSNVALVFGLSLYLGFVFLGVVMQRSRMITICFVIAPITTAIVIGLLIKPMFKADIFASLGLPFTAIILGVLAEGYRPNRYGHRSSFWHPITCYAIIPSILIAGIFLMGQPIWKSTNYRAAVAMIKAEMKPKDVIYVPDRTMFWGICWYFIGPNWGSPLAVAEPPNPRWQEIYSILGTQPTDRLRLNPRTQSIEYSGVTLIVGISSLPKVIGSQRIWLVTYANRNPMPTAIEELPRFRTAKFRGLQVDLIGRAQVN